MPTPSGTDVYQTLNLVVQHFKEEKENNFKAVQTVRGLMAGTDPSNHV
jgi:hypothetical protein